MLTASGYSHIKGSWAYISILTRFEWMFKWAFNQHSEIQALLPCPQFDTEPNKKPTKQTKTSGTQIKVAKGGVLYLLSSLKATQQKMHIILLWQKPCVCLLLALIHTLQHLENSLETLCLRKMLNTKYISLGNAYNSKGSCWLPSQQPHVNLMIQRTEQNSQITLSCFSCLQPWAPRCNLKELCSC